MILQEEINKVFREYSLELSAVWNPCFNFTSTWVWMRDPLPAQESHCGISHSYNMCPNWDSLLWMYFPICNKTMLKIPSPLHCTVNASWIWPLSCLNAHCILNAHLNVHWLCDLNAWILIPQRNRLIWSVSLSLLD